MGLTPHPPFPPTVSVSDVTCSLLNRIGTHLCQPLHCYQGTHVARKARAKSTSICGFSMPGTCSMAVSTSVCWSKYPIGPNVARLKPNLQTFKLTSLEVNNMTTDYRHFNSPDMTQLYKSLHHSLRAAPGTTNHLATIGSWGPWICTEGISSCSEVIVSIDAAPGFNQLLEVKRIITCYQ